MISISFLSFHGMSEVIFFGSVQPPFMEKGNDLLGFGGSHLLSLASPMKNFRSSGLIPVTL